MYKIQFIICFYLLINLTSFCQDTTYYHKFRTSDSHIVLTDWRVNFEQKGDKYIIETVDHLNRVSEIRLIYKETLYNGGTYDVSIIKFDYLNDTIIQHNMLNDSTYSLYASCYISKIIYIIKDNYIIKTIGFNEYDQILNSKQKFDLQYKKLIEIEKEKNKDGIEMGLDFVSGYQFSSSKYKGYLPIKKGFSFSEHNYYFQYNNNAKDSKFSMKNSPKLYNLKE